MKLYHLVGSAEWSAAQAAGEYRPASLDREGFIHLSTQAQWVGAANRFYRGRTDLLLLEVDADRLGAEVRFEAADGDRFPHLYGAMEARRGEGRLRADARRRWRIHRPLTRRADCLTAAARLGSHRSQRSAMSRSRHAVVTLVATALLALTAAPSGCKLMKKPAAGEPCSKPDQYVCTGATAALYCNAGTYMALPCGGPKGCSGVGAAARCDDDLANVGDACVTSVAGSNYSCSKDLKTEIMCQADKFVLDRPCKGPTACQVKNNAIYCDDSVADVGDPCTMGKYSCSSDHLTEARVPGREVRRAHVVPRPQPVRLQRHHQGHLLRQDRGPGRRSLRHRGLQDLRRRRQEPPVVHREQVRPVPGLQDRLCAVADRHGEVPVGSLTARAS